MNSTKNLKGIYPNKYINYLSTREIGTEKREKLSSYIIDLKDLGIRWVRDFVFLHYMGGRSDTDFWKSIDSLEIPNSLYLNLEKWKDRLPIQEDFINESSYIMFLSQNFIVVLDGLGLINYEKVKNNHEMQSTTEITEFINGEFKKQNEYENSTKFIPHKEYLSIIRNYF